MKIKNIQILKYNITEAGPREGTTKVVTYPIEVSSVIDTDGFVHVVFYVPNFILHFKDGTIFFIDATFKTVPQLDGAYQFLTFMCELYGKVIQCLINCLIILLLKDLQILIFI